MTQEFFLKQISRLKARFGEKHFDHEFVQLVAREVVTMSEPAFLRFVDVTIGSRTVNKPPLLSEFREARMNEERVKFQNDVAGAAQALRRGSPEEMRKNMRTVLSREFGAVDTLSDALEIARLKHRAKEGK